MSFEFNADWPIFVLLFWLTVVSAYIVSLKQEFNHLTEVVHTFNRNRIADVRRLDHTDEQLQQSVAVLNNEINDKLAKTEKQLVQLKLFQHALLYNDAYTRYYKNTYCKTKWLTTKPALYGSSESLAYYYATGIVLIINRLHMAENYGPNFEHNSYMYPQLEGLHCMGYNQSKVPFAVYMNSANIGHTLQSLEQYIRNLSGNDFAGLSDNPSDNDALCRSVLTYVNEISASWSKQSDISWTFTD